MRNASKKDKKGKYCHHVGKAQSGMPVASGEVPIWGLRSAVVWTGLMQQANRHPVALLGLPFQS